MFASTNDYILNVSLFECLTLWLRPVEQKMVWSNDHRHDLNVHPLLDCPWRPLSYPDYPDLRTEAATNQTVNWLVNLLDFTITAGQFLSCFPPCYQSPNPVG